MTAFTADTTADLGGPQWLRDRRRAAFDRFRSAPRPTSEDEVWRYSRIDDLDLDAFSPVPETIATEGGHLPEALRAVVDAIGPHAGLIVIRNGRVTVAHLDPELEAEGVFIGAAGDDEVRALPGPEDALVHLHDANVSDVALVCVPDGVVVGERPIVVLSWVDADRAAVFPRVIVQAGRQSEITIVEHSAGADVAALTVPIVELQAGDGATIRHLAVQDLGPRTWQVGQLRISGERDSTIRSWFVVLGGEYARLFVDVQLPGQGATADVKGVYFGDGSQVHDIRSVQRHVTARGTSDFTLKGAVVDDARGVYSGVIVVEAGAKATSAFLTNRNLVLSDGARVDSVPNLEIINENDLKSCGHAAATGPVDEEHLFYLESRGVPTEVAERLIVLGFFGEVLDEAPVPGLRALLRQAVAVKLGGRRDG